MNTNTIRFDRLEMLAEHLEKGQLGHERFDFRFYNNDYSKCGTSGCAMGECPVLWPDQWEWYHDSVVLSEQKGIGPEMSGMRWFSITLNEYAHLFIPLSQDPAMFGGELLERDATRYEVAANIRAFIEKMREQEAAGAIA